MKIKENTNDTSGWSEVGTTELQTLVLRQRITPKFVYVQVEQQVYVKGIQTETQWKTIRFKREVK